LKAFERIGPYKALKGPYKALKGPYKALKWPYKAAFFFANSHDPLFREFP